MVYKRRRNGTSCGASALTYDLYSAAFAEAVVVLQTKASACRSERFREADILSRSSFGRACMSLSVLFAMEMKTPGACEWVVMVVLLRVVI